MKCTLKKERMKYFFDIDGVRVEPSAYMSYCIEKKNIDSFKKHGIKLFMFPIYAGDEGINMESGLRSMYPGFFKGYGKYDFSCVKELMDIIAPMGEEGIYVIPRVCLEPPVWWQEMHPNECARDHKGERQRECFTSQKWREDMSIALKALIDFFENSKWKNNIIGYHIAAGGTEEWAYHSRYNKQFYDYSDVNLKAYHNFLKEKYDNISSLSKAWEEKYSSFDEIIFPKPAERLYAKEGNLRDEKSEKNVLDFFDFHNKAVADTIIYFCKEVKDYTNGERVTGAFYGYVVAMPHNKKGLHAMGELLKSPYIDFISTTNFGPGPGYSWAFSSAVNSVLLNGKLWMSEGDIRTHRSADLSLMKKIPHAAPDNNYYGGSAWRGPENLFLSCSALKKAISRNLTVPCGIWWFDMFGGWYDEDEMMNIIEKMAPLYTQQNEELFKSETALIIDEKGHKYYANNEVKQSLAMRELGENISHCGAPYDIYLQSDLTNPAFPTDQYKLYIFACTPNPSDKEKEFIEKLKRDNKVLMWINSSAFYDKDLSGFSLSRSDGYSEEKAIFENAVYPQNPLPAPEFEQQSGYVLSRFEQSGKPAVLWKNMGNWDSVCCLPQAPSASLLRHIALLAGVHLYNLDEDVVYAGGNFVTIHALKEGYRRINLPYANCRAKNALTGEEIKVNDRFIDLNMEKYDTVIIKVECKDKTV